MDELIKLGLNTLENLPESVSCPSYKRSQMSPGMVHIGVGNFHRAHQAWYLHRLMQQGSALDWAIVGSGVRLPSDEQMRQRLLDQDFLTTLIELDPKGVSSEVVGSMIGFLPVETDNAALIAQMADPAIRIVSLTVTEGGYYIDPVSGAFDTTHPEIVHDSQNPERPKTAFGAIVAALKSRKENAHQPFTVMSCDNLMGNGAVVQQTVVSLARMSNPALADWIDENCCFPNSMVDCIVPATGEKELSLVRELGIDDQAPVTHENFRQWVIEDNFCAGRPDWHLVGVTFTKSVHDYEVMKLRILNAGHQILANAGEILSVETISQCMNHPAISAMFSKVQLEEIVPQVAPVPGMEPAQYVKLIENRFSNEAIVDTTRRVAFDGSSRHTGFLLPIVNERVAANLPVEGLALVEAIWARMCEGTREDGTVIEPNDPFWDDLKETAVSARKRPLAWLEQEQYYGNLKDAQSFADAFDRWLEMIWEIGVAKTLDQYTSNARSAFQSKHQQAGDQIRRQETDADGVHSQSKY